jgi:hypothetical protein
LGFGFESVFESRTLLRGNSPRALLKNPSDSDA